MRPRHRVAAAAAIALPSRRSVRCSPSWVRSSRRRSSRSGWPARRNPTRAPVDGADRRRRFDRVVVVVLVSSPLARRAADRPGHAAGRRKPSPARRAARIARGVAHRRPSRSGCDSRSTAGASATRSRCGRRCSAPRSACRGRRGGAGVLGGLDHLVATPAAYGWTWDLTATTARPRHRTARLRAAHDRLSPWTGIIGVASVCTGGVEVGGRPVTGWGYYEIRGNDRTGDRRPAAHRGPTTRSRSAPKTLGAVHRSVGDTVRIAGASGSKMFRIVGQAAFPGLSDPEPLADGAAFTAAGLEPAWRQRRMEHRRASLAPGVEPRRGDRGQRQRRQGPRAAPSGPRCPPRSTACARSDGLPVALAAFVAVVALVAVGLAPRRRPCAAVVASSRCSRRSGSRVGRCRRPSRGRRARWPRSGSSSASRSAARRARSCGDAVADELGVSPSRPGPSLGVVAARDSRAVLVRQPRRARFPARRALHATRPAVVLRSE